MSHENSNLKSPFIHDDYADEDLVGHSFARDALLDLIKGANKAAKSSFTIGVFGEWGTGKTSMLRQLEADLSANSDYVPIWFNPWQFSKDSDIVRAFFQSLAEELSELASADGSVELSKFKTASSKIKEAATAFKYKTSWSFQIPFLAKMMIAPERVEPTRELGSFAHLQDTFENHYQSIYYDMARFLRKTTQDLDTTIVVFIDDLDRCMPEQALELLEGLKVLLDLPNFVFVVGVAHKLIERAVGRRYNEYFGEASQMELDDRANYLDKIFQFSFVLPRPNADKIIQNIIFPALPRLQDLPEFARTIVAVIGTNPRSIKRFLNVVSFAKSLASNRFETDAAEIDLVIKSALIAFVLPDLHRSLERHPEALVRIDQSIRKIDENATEDLRALLITGWKVVDDLITNQVAVKLHQILDPAVSAQGFESDSIAYRYLNLSSSSLNPADSISKKHHQPRKDSDAGEVSGRLVKVSGGSISRLGRVPLDAELNVGAFLVDQYPVTQEFYEEVIGSNPSEFIDPTAPVENVSWFDAVNFCNKLSLKMGLEQVYKIAADDPSVVDNDYSKNGFRLPTEAEWEFLCRKGLTDEYEIDEVAWYMKNSGATSHSVGSKLQNQFGVFDLLGNVWEWCSDWYLPLNNGPSEVASHKLNDRVCRGGSWANFANSVHAEHRGRRNPLTKENNLGFRVVISEPL